MLFEPFPEAGYIDQFAHVTIGFLITLLLMSMSLSASLAVLFTMLIAFIREMWQHPLRVGPGSRTDLAFWFIGCIIAVITYMEFLI